LERPSEESQGFKPDPGNLAVRDYRGASGNVSHGETVNPSCNRKSRNGNPSPTAGRARFLSQWGGSSPLSLGQLAVPGGARRFSGRRQPSCGGTSRMMREYQVRICERLGMKFPGPTRQDQKPGASGVQPGAGSVRLSRQERSRLAAARLPASPGALALRRHGTASEGWGPSAHGMQRSQERSGFFRVVFAAGRQSGIAPARGSLAL
jgi:hypothetical protein